MTGVRLEPFTAADFGRLISWVPDEAFLIQWAGPIFSWPLDEYRLEAYVAPMRYDPPERLVWRAVAEDGDRADDVIGHVELAGIDRRHRGAVLARVLLAPEARGRGLGRAMCERAMAIAFDELGLHRLELRVFDYNSPAIACYESLGFAHEGRHRDTRCINGRWLTTLTMGMLEDEWRARGGAGG